MNARAVWLIAKSVLIEAVRRKEIYTIVLISTLLIGAVMTVDFFNLDGLTKFYREIALKVMSIATAMTTIVLAARQLPREFDSRTIYPLMARPISRAEFLGGKLLGVMCAAAFCFALFMAVYIIGNLWLQGDFPVALFVQYIYLQLLMMLVLATLSMWLSLLATFDAAITIGVLFYLLSTTLTTVTMYLYDFVGAIGQKVLVLMIYLIPQITLFDLSGKAVHSDKWDPVGIGTMTGITLYGGVYALIYFGLTLLWFRRRAL